MRRSPRPATDRKRTLNLLPYFEAMQAAPALEHLQRLDDGWARLLRGERPPDPLSLVEHAALPATEGEFDVVYAGGGLGLLHALAMVQQGWRVLLFDQGVIGTTHREWNISRPELEGLIRANIFEPDELESVIAREYERGFIRFHNPHGEPARLELPGVLDVALDAPALLSLARRKFEQAGGVLREGFRFEHGWLARDGAPRAVVAIRGEAGETLRIGARLLVNGMGALSPLSLALAGASHPFDGLCPTVGTVARGFAEGEVAPEVGEILVTLEGAREGRQLIWEGFPTHGDSFTTYLFYYDITRGRAGQPHSLQALFSDYFDLLADYKWPGNNFRHLRPVYGFIPARHHQDGPPHEQARTARALLSIADAAARQNPLTFTGFGSFVRHLPDATGQLSECLRQNDLEADTLASLSAAHTNLSAMWVMARFLSPRAGSDDVNGILRDFTLALRDVGPERAAAFFLDRAPWRDYVEIMLRTARHRPQVVADAVQVLGPRGVAQWLEDLWRWKLQEGDQGLEQGSSG